MQKEMEKYITENDKKALKLVKEFVGEKYYNNLVKPMLLEEFKTYLIFRERLPLVLKLPAVVEPTSRDLEINNILPDSPYICDVFLSKNYTNISFKSRVDKRSKQKDYEYYSYSIIKDSENRGITIDYEWKDYYYYNLLLSPFLEKILNEYNNELLEKLKKEVLLAISRGELKLKGNTEIINIFKPFLWYGVVGESNFYITFLFLTTLKKFFEMLLKNKQCVINYDTNEHTFFVKLVHSGILVTFEISDIHRPCEMSIKIGDIFISYLSPIVATEYHKELYNLIKKMYDTSHHNGVFVLNKEYIDEIKKLIKEIG